MQPPSSTFICGNKSYNTNNPSGSQWTVVINCSHNMCVCAMVTSCGYYSREAFRASDCAATFQGRPLFEEMQYILDESLLTIKL